MIDNRQGTVDEILVLICVKIFKSKSANINTVKLLA